MKKNSASIDMIADYRFNSILIKNGICFFVVFFVPLFIQLYIGYGNYRYEIVQQMQNNNASVLDKCVSISDNLIGEVVQLTDIINENINTQRFFNNNITDDNDSENLTSNLMIMINQNRQSYRYVKQIYLYSSCTGMTISGEIKKPLTAIDEKWRWLYPYINKSSKCIFTNGENSLEICRTTDDGNGLIVIQIDLLSLRNLLQKDENLQSRWIMMIDYSGNLVCGTEDLNQSELNGIIKSINGCKSGTTKSIHGDMTVSILESGTNAFTYLLVTDNSYFVEEKGRNQFYLNSSIITLIICVIMATIITTFISYLPIKKIINVIKDPYKKGTKKVEKRNELLYITGYIMNDMKTKKQLSTELQQRVESLNVAQSCALQFQMDPHFLANMLEVIKWSSVGEQGIGNNTSQMITKLALFYRNYVHGEEMLLKFRDELESLKLYIDLLNYRYEDRIKYEFNIPDETLDCSVVKMTMQPLLENAIRHGLKSKSYYGNIKIFASIIEHNLVITISNDGENISSSMIDKINDDLKSSDFIGEHVGLKNVNARIKLIFGDSYGVVLKLNTPNNGVSSIMTLPTI